MGQEADITRQIYESLRGLRLSFLRRVHKGKSVTTGGFKSAVADWYGREIPWPLAEPDLILVFEDSKRAVNDSMIVAIEIKFFDDRQDLDKRLRQCFREIGQPLRNLIFGFDSAVLWHVFSDRVREDRIGSYTDVVAEVMRRLKLAVVYLATTVPDERFKLYKPSPIDSFHMERLAYLLQGLCDQMRNPAMDEEVNMRRNCLKLSLGIPA